MCFTLIEQARRVCNAPNSRCRVQRRVFEKAAKSKADVIFLDVEDAVAPDDKEQARKNIIAGLNDVDWGSKTMTIRINGLDTHYMYRDVVDIVEACPRLDMILIPKVGVPADVYALDMLVTQIETAKKREKRIGFEVLIETALGMANVEAIAQSSEDSKPCPSASPIMRLRPGRAPPSSAASTRITACWPTRMTPASATIFGPTNGTQRRPA